MSYKFNYDYLILVLFARVFKGEKANREHTRYIFVSALNSADYLNADELFPNSFLNSVIKYDSE